MKYIVSRLIFLGLPLLLGLSVLQARDFRAAAGKIDITPPAGLKMWGYSARSGESARVLDPLHARILILEADALRLALVTLDLGRTHSEIAMNLVRERVRDPAQIQEVFFFASHTHSGPVIEDHASRSEIPEWELAMLERIVAGIEEASAQLAPARIGAGSGEKQIGHNRRLIQPDGSVKMLWRNATKTPTSPVDARVGVIRIDDLRGTPLAVLVNHACHPVILGPDNLSYSADFAGAMAGHVEDKMTGNPVCLFLQGAAGDINPYLDKTPLEQDGARLMR